MFLKDNFKLKIKKSLIQKLQGKNILDNSLLFSNQTGIKVHANPGLVKGAFFWNYSEIGIR